MNNVNNRLCQIGSFIPESDDDVIICRCEEITKGDIRKAVHEGMFTLTEIRRYLRVGMGLCQGQSCSRQTKLIVSGELGIPDYKLEPVTSRSPMRPIEMKIWGNENGL